MNIVISSSKLEKEEKYTLIIGNDEVESITIDSITNTSGYSYGGNMPGGPAQGYGPGRR